MTRVYVLLIFVFSSQIFFCFLTWMQKNWETILDDNDLPWLPSTTDLRVQNMF